MSEFIRRLTPFNELFYVKEHGGNVDRDEMSGKEQSADVDHAESRSQGFTRAFTTLFVFLFVFLEHFVCFKSLQDTPLYLVLQWLTSVAYVALFYILARNRPSFIPNEATKGKFADRVTLVVFYIVTTYIKESDLASQVTSQGSSAFLVNLCLSPLVVTASMTCLHHHQPASWISAVTVAYSGMMLMTVCSDEGSCYSSIKDAAFNFVFTAVYAIFLIKLAQYLYQASVVRTLLLLNTCNAVVLPVLLLFSNEGEMIWNDPTVLFTFLHPTIVLPLILLKIFQMITAVLHVKLTSVTTHVMTRNLAWVPSCIAISTVCHIELMVSSFKSFWIVVVCYLLHFIPDEQETKRPLR